MRLAIHSFLKRGRAVVASLLIISALASCGSPTNVTASKTAGNSEENAEYRLDIITTIFPHYDFTRAVVGDRADITMLLSPGVESHSYDPTPADIIAINECDLFIYTGADMEAWVEGILEGSSNKDMRVIALAEEVSTSDIHIHKDGDDHSDHGNLSDSDDREQNHFHIHDHEPHIWTSPVIVSAIVESILAAVCEIDPDNEQYYTENANAYKVALEELDAEFREIVADAKRKEIFFGDRFALTYFAEEYGIDFHAAFDSCSSESEPSTSVITNMIDEIIDKEIPVIYYAELNDPKIARTLSEHTGAEMLLFHSCHNVTKEEFDSGITYIDLMWQNAKNLRKGLN